MKIALVDTGVASDPDDELGLKHVKHVDVIDEPAGDGLGHGTFLAGIIGGTGSNGGFQGVAPGADLYDIKVADAQGNTSLSKVLLGLEAAR